MTSSLVFAGVGDTWRSAPAVIAAAAVLLVLFAQAFVRLRARGRSDHADWTRAVLFVSALAIGTLALVSPLDAAGDEYLISAHMLQHMLIADAAPALAIVAVRGPLLFFLLPSAVLGPLARLRLLRRVLRALVEPPVAVTAWVATFAAWHVPALYDATLRHLWLHDLEHLTFVTAGVLLWTQLVYPARRRELSVAGRTLVALAVFVAGQALAYALIFSLTPLYASYASQPVRLLGLSPLLDQQLAGVVMMGEQLLTLGVWAALVLMPTLRLGRGVRAGRAPVRSRAGSVSRPLLRR